MLDYSLPHLRLCGISMLTLRRVDKITETLEYNNQAINISLAKIIMRFLRLRNSWGCSLWSKYSIKCLSVSVADGLLVTTGSLLMQSACIMSSEGILSDVSHIFSVFAAEAPVMQAVTTVNPNYKSHLDKRSFTSWKLISKVWFVTVSSLSNCRVCQSVDNFSPNLNVSTTTGFIPLKLHSWFPEDDS